jgi:hypothetical protein
VARPRRAGLRSSERALPDEEVRMHEGLRITSPERTWFDLAADQPAAELLVVGDALLRAGHLSMSALAELVDRAGGARGVVFARRVAPLLDAGAASRPESIVRWSLLDSDLPPPEVQVPVRNRGGVVVAHGDLGYER